MESVLKLVLLGLAAISAKAQTLWQTGKGTELQSGFTKPPIDIGVSDVSGEDLEHLQDIMEALNITFSVQCCNSGKTSRATTCGAGKSCKNICGSIGAPAKVINQAFRGVDYCASYSQPVPGIIISIPCFSWVNSFCNLPQVVDNGNNCPALYESIGPFSLDFCCFCNSVFRSCKCDCCKCRQVGGACNGSCGGYTCPSK